MIIRSIVAGSLFVVSPTWQTTVVVTIAPSGQIYRHGDIEQPLELLSRETLDDLVKEIVAFQLQRR